MKNIMHLLFVIIFVCFGDSIHGMEPTSFDELRRSGKENSIQISQLQQILSDLIVPIARYCKPRVKTILMKVCKTFNTQLKNRELIVQVNPFTVSQSDILRSIFVCTNEGDVNKLRIWLNAAKEVQVSVNSLNILKKLPYDVAKEKNNEKIMDLLVEYGADISKASQLKILITKEYELYEAVYWGNKERVKELLELDKVDPNIAFDLFNKATPLCIAAHEGHIDIVQLLIDDTHIRVNQCTLNNKFPLYFAAQKGRVEIVRLLLKAGANIVSLQRYLHDHNLSALSIAAEKGHVEIVDLLLRDKPDLNEADSHSLSMAVTCGHTKVAKLLIAAGADVNYLSMEHDGHNLLYLAAENGDIKMVDLLLMFISKKYIDQTDSQRRTPLCLAVRGGNLDMVQSLLDAGADPNKPLGAGRAPLHIAAKTGCIEIVKLLLNPEIGTHQRISNLSIETALRMAEEKGHTHIVEFLQGYLDQPKDSIEIENYWFIREIILLR